ncbi:eukaryotic translation initiation factor 3 subunit H-like [Saccoglossus kowalevskii]|uniref:Eukaryotic translation initiation factor 3 subunit H n=1 Tax=Saccoglossus kowalevskii TaxID=10224 RepID=A0ABM0GUF0_SACKO|nr:PREDICTED: eukaryotic translation initiation factor 3 subunit H-like [Saccoglossus kowalevskii]
MAASSPVARVQIDGLVVLKIVKHCQEESTGGSELVQGVLLGLVVDNTLEITNCFPFPRHTDDEDFDEVQYQMEMMRNLRHVNIDHLHVGWYQSTYYGAFMNKALLDSQFNYQHSIEESVVLIYDPIKTTRGTLCLKAYRLTPQLMHMYKEGDFTPESIKKSSLSYEQMFEEIPIVIKNSHLINTLLCEIENKSPPKEGNFLNLATGSVLKKNLRLLMDSVDELNQDTNKFINYQRNVGKQQQAKQQYLYKRTQENMALQGRGEAPLPEEDLSKIFKPITVPSRLDSLLVAGQIKHHTDLVNQFASQSFGKLFMCEALQPKQE